MKEKDFKKFIGKNLVVDYYSNGEKQTWSLKNFYIKGGVVKHSKIPFNTSLFIKRCNNPHIGRPTHI